MGETRRMSLLRAILVSSCLLTPASPARAADAAERAVHGFSSDGRYFAFEQFGVQDGSGFPYADIFIVDLEGDKWVDGTPLRVLLEDERHTLGAARGEAMARAKPFIDRLAIGEPGVVLATNVIYQANADPRRMVFTRYYTPLGNIEPCRRGGRRRNDPHPRGDRAPEPRGLSSRRHAPGRVCPQADSGLGQP